MSQDMPLTDQATQTAHPVPAGPANIGRFRIVRLLGQGGMGLVYLAHDPQLDRPVALKVPHFTSAEGADVLQRFLREARAAATLQHPNICPVYEVGEADGQHYLAMAYIEGQPLSALVAPTNLLPQDQVAALVRKVALALDKAHRRGIVHRDLKPGNIMLTQQGEPVVMDFGLARRIDSDDARLTKSGTIVGTPAYMAPEQARADVAHLGPACDIYSLGVVLYELLTGRLPFQGGTAAVLAQVLLDEPERPAAHRPDVNPTLEAICLRAMAKKPEERFASMSEFAGALALCETVPAGRPLAADIARTDNRVTTSLLNAEARVPSKEKRAEALRLAAFFGQLRELSRLQQAAKREAGPGYTIFLGCVPGGILGAVVGLILAANLFQPASDTLFALLIFAGILVFAPAVSVLLLIARGRSLLAPERLSQIIANDFPHEVEEWGGIAVLRNPTAIQKLIGMLEKTGS